MRKVLVGKVVSDKMQKTVIVEVVRKTPHPLYKKLLTRSKKYKADTGKFSLVIGDNVKIGEIKPMSKSKNFEVIEIFKETEEKGKGRK